MDACIEHKGKPRPNGYVRVTFKQQSWYAHRLAWMQEYGEIPERMDICHRCDNRRCINLNHLFLGTRKDNMQDAKNKGRTAKGFNLPHTKLSETDKVAISVLAQRGIKYKEIARIFDIHRAYAGSIALSMGIKRHGISK